jgi:2-polyprenyl-3-methyl-5-hydroxy-6-metoxy-1,4-benzoquinol methylase
MDSSWVQRWDDRYNSQEYAYGELPNNYLREQLEKITPGSILFPAEGEGRNAVFAALMGWEVFAFDISEAGKLKALRLAESNNVTIDYQVGSLDTFNFKDEQFDAIALIYAHFPAEIKSSIHRSLNKYLKKNGIIIFEAFSKRHLEFIAANENVGGPKNVEMLFSKEEIRTDFSGYEVIELEEKIIELHEGLYHNGKGSVIRFVGRKK